MKTGEIKRNSLDLFQECMQHSPVTVISGGRQTGKSTLVRMLLDSVDSPTMFVNLDDKISRDSALEDPDGFADQFPEGVLAIDEVQRVPELFLSVKAALERNRRPGRFILTGSSNLSALQGRQESLAGRATHIQLEGFSRDELAGRRSDFASLAWSLGKERTAALDLNSVDLPQRSDYMEMLVNSDSPAVLGQSARWQGRWIKDYIDLVITRDASEISTIRYPDRLEPLLNLLAANNAGELNKATISRLIDLPASSVDPYLATLENVFLIRRLPAWSNNLLKRAVSRQKVYLRDTGMAAHLCGLDAKALETDISSTITGGLLEGFVVGELAKQSAWSEIDYRMFHFRDSNGPEVDIILENRRREIVGIEVKATTSIGTKHFAGLKYLQSTLGEQMRAGIVLHGGKHIHRFGPGLWALPIASLWLG